MSTLDLNLSTLDLSRVLCVDNERRRLRANEGGRKVEKAAIGQLIDGGEARSLFLSLPGAVGSPKFNDSPCRLLISHKPILRSRAWILTTNQHTAVNMDFGVTENEEKKKDGQSLFARP